MSRRPTSSKLSTATSSTESRQQAAKERCDRIYSEWLATRAQIEDHRTKNFDRLCDHADELALLVCTTPAAAPYHLFNKLEVLEFCLARDMRDGIRADRSCITLLGGIKADLSRYELQEPDAS